MKTLLSLGCLLLALGALAEAPLPPLVTVTVLPFSTHGHTGDIDASPVAEQLRQVIGAKPDLLVVEPLPKHIALAAKTLRFEQALPMANEIGARILVTGTFLKSKHATYLIARVIGVDTGKVTGCSVRGDESLDILAAQLAEQVAQTILDNRQELLWPEDLMARQRTLLARQQQTDQQIPQLDIHFAEKPAADLLAELALAAGVKLADSGDTLTGHLQDERLQVEKGGAVVQARLEYRIVDDRGNLVASGPIVSIARADTVDAATTRARQEALFRLIDSLIPRLDE